MNFGFTFVSFKDEVTRDVILEIGVIHFNKKSVVLRHCSKDIDTTQMVKSILVWIRLNELGLQYWGKKNLSALVSTIGKPIMVDKVNLERSMIKFARVLVDVEFSDDPLKIIAYANERKQLVEQQVEYEWLLSKCVAYALLGHTVENCNKGTLVVWKIKQSGCKGDWITPQKRGSKNSLNPQANAMRSNRYEVLKENIKGMAAFGGSHSFHG
uniref:DUF4283 domain-containing protein n=1 Tax=Cannabis sativa TaxID=3483 RepID=A0A803PDR7_CANSA